MLLLDAREALAGFDRLRARARVVRSGAGGRVSVGFLWSTLSAFLPQLVAAAAERHPDIELSVSQLVFLEMLPALRRGDVDLVIGRSAREESDIVEETLRREPSVLAMPEGHPFTRQDTLRLAQLDGEPMIAFSRALVPSAYDASVAAARERGVEIRIVQHARSAGEALALVSAGLGVYRLPASAVAPYTGVTYREIRGCSGAGGRSCAGRLPRRLPWRRLQRSHTTSSLMRRMHRMMRRQVWKERWRGPSLPEP